MIFSNLPYEIKSHIFSYLEPEDLNHTITVSKEWKHLSERQRLNCLNGTWISEVGLNFERIQAFLKKNGDKLHSLLLPACSFWNGKPLNYEDGNNRTLELIKCCPNIKKLKLSHISDDLMMKLKDLKIPLIKLHLFANESDRVYINKNQELIGLYNHFRKVEILTDFFAFSNLQTLSLCCISKVVKGLITFDNFPRLKKLKFDCCEVRDEDLENLMKLTGKLDLLQKLNLGNNKITNRGVEQIVNAKLSRLKKLKLHGNHIENNGLLSLALNPYFQQLEILDLSLNKIDGEGIKEFANTNLPYFKNLKILNLSYLKVRNWDWNPRDFFKKISIPDEAIISLAKKIFPQLVRIELCGNNTSGEVMNEIKSAPNFFKMRF